MSIEETGSNFDKVLELVGNNGYFQKRFNVLFIFLLSVTTLMPNFNIILSLSVPDHWCFVPGRENFNFSEQEWKSYTIPKEKGTQGKHVFSSCKMYNTSNSYQNITMREHITRNYDIIDCQHGWEYDRTWFVRTAVTQENWVCHRELHVTNTFAFAKIGDFLGTFICGQLGDMFGRRPIFFFTLVVLLFGRLLAVFTSGYISIFLFAALLGNMATPAVYQSPLVIAMETSRNEDRAFIAMLQTLGGTCGLCLLPLIMWILKDWIPFLWVTTAPCALFLFCPTFMIESPRWLASRGRIAKCIKELEKVATANRKRMPDEVAILLQESNVNTGTVHGYLSLFTNFRLAKNTLLLVCVWIISGLVYYILIVNVGNLEGNPFLNYFWLALAELPAYVLGKYACDVIGRRWTQIGGFTGTAMGCTLLIFVINEEKYTSLSSAMVIFLKFSISFAYYSVNVHSVEIYPTCIRQTGVSLGIISSSAFATLGPYIVYLGTSVNLIYPYIIMGTLCLFGAVCGIYLPETLNKQLPETLEDSKYFGADQGYWCLPREIVHDQESTELK